MAATTPRSDTAGRQDARISIGRAARKDHTSGTLRCVTRAQQIFASAQPKLAVEAG